MLSNENLSDKEIVDRGSRALIKELGYTGFLRYIRQVESVKGEDYLKVQDKIYEGMSIEEVYNTAKEYCDTKPENEKKSK